MNQFRIQYGFLTATVILFIVELLIALLVSGFVRAHVGDTLIVILIYCFLRIFYTGARRTLPFYVFLFAVLVEAGQACNIAGLLSLEPDSMIGIAIGKTFDWTDILCYAAGSALCYLHLAVGSVKWKMMLMVQLVLWGQIFSLMSCKSRTEVEKFLDRLPKVELPVETSGLLEKQITYTREEQEIVRGIFTGGFAWDLVKSKSENFPIVNMFRFKIKENIMALLVTSVQSDGKLSVHLVTLNQFCRVTAVRNLHYDRGRWGNQISAESWIGKQEIIIKEYLDRFLISKTTFKISGEGYIEEIRTQGTAALQYKCLADEVFFVDEFIWGQVSEAGKPQPREELKTRVYLSEDRKSMEIPLYAGKIYKTICEIDGWYDRFSYIWDRFDYKLPDGSRMGFWSIGSPDKLLAYIAKGDRLEHLVYTAGLPGDIPGDIKDYYDATVEGDNGLMIHGSNHAFRLRFSPGRIVVDSLVLYAYNTDIAGNKELLIAPLGKDKLAGVSFNDFTPEFTGLLFYENECLYRPITDYIPDYDLQKEFCRKMLHYYSKIRDNSLPCRFNYDFGLPDKYDSYDIFLPQGLYPFFTSRDGMGERENIAVARLKDERMGFSLLLMDCQYQEKPEYYLYILDKDRKITDRLPLVNPVGTELGKKDYISIEVVEENLIKIVWENQDVPGNESFIQRLFRLDSSGKLVLQ